ncbi:MAG: hypothetical protein IJY63_05465 [Clostridia bacterium]|nr:hypothetical protein [Clostridia bacterium]
MNNKIETYIGFSIRSGKIIFGVEMLERQKKGVYLLIADGAIGKNSLKSMVNAQAKFGCPFLMTDEGVLSATVHRPAVKAVAITDQNLAKAILSVADGEPQIKFYSGGNN